MLSDITADFERLTGGFAPLAECRPSSPEAYNAISATIMRHYYTAVRTIESEHGIGYPSNLGVLLFNKLHIEACQHYFQEYDRLNGFSFAEPAQTGVFSVASARRLLGQAKRGLRRRLSSAIAGRTGNFAARIGFAGTTTFPWEPLQHQLGAMGVSLSPVPAGRPRAIPLIDQQRTHLERWASEAHEAIAAQLNAGGALQHFDPARVADAVAVFMRTPPAPAPAIDLLITGSLGPLQTRAAALSAASKGVPVLTVHHGAQYKTFDEPYYDLYEGNLPAAKMVYGSIERQRAIGTLARERNLDGRDILLFTRTDDLVRRLYTGEAIRELGSLQGKTLLYLGTEFESGRYGPYRDVHPLTYRAWQQALIDWLTRQAGLPPLVRLHPKRPSTIYDPHGYAPADGPLEDALEAADALVVDYPTTSLGIAAATTKPVLFFDLGLRRLYPAALDAVRSRCAYAPLDVLDPGAGLNAMEADLGRSFEDAYSPLFTVSGVPDDEVTTLAKAVVDAVERLR